MDEMMHPEMKSDIDRFAAENLRRSLRSYGRYLKLCEEMGSILGKLQRAEIREPSQEDQREYRRLLREFGPGKA